MDGCPLRDDPWKGFLDAIGYGMASLDSAGRILSCNRAFSLFCELAPTPLPEPSWSALVARAMGTGRTASAGVGRGGREYAVHIHPASGRDGPSGAACVVSDVTGLAFLFRSALRLSELAIVADVVRYVADEVAGLVGDAVVMVSELDTADGQTRVLAMAGGGGPTHPPGPAVGPIYDFGTGFQSWLGGPSLTRVSEEPADSPAVHVIPLSTQGRFHRLLAIHTQRPGPLPEAGLVEAFVLQASAALQSRDAVLALQRAEERYTDLVANLNVGLYRVTVGPSTRFLDVNPAMIAMFEARSRDELMTAEVKDLFLGDPLGHLRERMLRDGFIRDEEVRAVTLRGREFRTSVAAVIRQDPGGGAYVDGVVDDVSRRKQVEEDLRHNEQRFRFMAEAVPAMVFTADADGKCQYLNRRFYDYTGMAPGQGLGSGWMKALHPDDFRACQEEWERAHHEGVSYDSAYRLRRADGAYRWFVARSHPMRDASGQIVNWVGTTTDIDDLKQTQEALNVRRREAERQATQMSELFKSMTEGVTIADAEGLIVLRNAAAVKMVGVPKDGHLVGAEFLGVRLLSLDEVPIPRDRFPIRRLLKGEKVVDEEFILERVDGSRLRIVCSGATVSSSVGEVELAVLTFRDVSELRRLESAKDEFLQVVAHELRNPLATAYGLVQLVTQRLVAERETRHVEHLLLAESELNRLNGLIGEIISGYRVSGGRLSLDLQRVNLADIITEATRPYVLAPSDHSLTLAPLPAAALPAIGDAKRLVEILANLLSNAIKYSPAGRRIWVKTSCKGGSVLIRVEDEGIGIPPDQLEKVFEGFYRASNVVDRQLGGLGLGLYISRDVARRHGGDLWAENRPGGGTIMCLRLPLGVGDTPSA